MLAERLWQEQALARVQRAAMVDPPDLRVLLRATRGWNWSVASAAAAKIGGLASAGALTEPQQLQAIGTLMRRLASGGVWWRLGWDRDETA